MPTPELIWYKDAVGFWRRDRLLRFFPTSSLPVVGQLNAVFRFCIYYAGIMIALTRNPRHAVVVLVGALFTAAIRELAYRSSEIDMRDLHGDGPRVRCTRPSKDNPYMNLRAFDPVDKAPACKQWAMGTASEDAMGEPIQDSPFQRPANRFYTMPNTTPTSDQAEFAHWLYGSMPSKFKSEGSPAASERSEAPAITRPRH